MKMLMRLEEPWLQNPPPYHHCRDSISSNGSNTSTPQVDLVRLPYSFLSNLISFLPPNDLLSLCKSSQQFGEVFSQNIFWRRALKQLLRHDFYLRISSQASRDQHIFVRTFLETLLKRSMESLCVTYLPALNEKDSYSGKVLYLHEIYCGQELRLADNLPNIPAGVYELRMRTKVNSHWHFPGKVRVRATPAQGVPLSTCLTAVNWQKEVFRHGYDRWFMFKMGRFVVNQQCAVQFELFQQKHVHDSSQASIKEGIYWDFMELVPLQCWFSNMLSRRGGSMSVPSRDLCQCSVM